MAKRKKYEEKLSKYVNKDQRDQLLMLDRLGFYLEEKFLKLWVQYGKLTATEKKQLKTAFTMIDKAEYSIVSRLDPTVAHQMKRDVANTTIFCLPSSQADIKIKRYHAESENDFIEVQQDLIDDLAMKAMYWCKHCDETNHETCCLRSTLLNLKVAPLDTDHPICPYYDDRGKHNGQL